MADVFSKHFSIEEAERWLPRLRSLFARIEAALEAVSGELEILHRTRVRRGNGGGIDVDTYFAEDAVLVAALQEIQQAGILIKDVRRGLVDFPTHVDGREVFLCWELKESDRIGFYHPIHLGYAGRRPLSR